MYHVFVINVNKHVFVINRLTNMCSLLIDFVAKLSGYAYCIDLYIYIIYVAISDAVFKSHLK